MISLREATLINLSVDAIIKLKELVVFLPRRDIDTEEPATRVLKTSLEELDLQLLSLTDEELIQRFEIEIEGVTRLYYIYHCLDSIDMIPYLHEVDIGNFVSIIKSKHNKDEDQLIIISYQRIIKNNDELEVILNAFNQDMKEYCIQLLFKRGKEEALFKRLMYYVDSKSNWSDDFIGMVTMITLNMEDIPIEWIYKLNKNNQLKLIYEAHSIKSIERLINHFGLNIDTAILGKEENLLPTVVLSLAKKGMSLDWILPRVAGNKRKYVLTVYNDQV